MVNLLDVLESRNRRSLQAVAYSHALPFNSKRTKEIELRRLHHLMIEKNNLDRTYHQLNDNMKEALTALQAAGGDLPLGMFTKAFGQIRPYRPWRDDAPRHPWRHPVSVAEKLWFLAFIEIVPGPPRRVIAPAEVLALLPPLPRPQAIPEPVVSPKPGGEFIPVDLAMLLGTLLAVDLHPAWHRWLPLRVLRQLNRRLSVPDDLDGVKSELQTGRLRFLHYLAEAARLVSLQANLLKPTPAAWEWVNASPPARWQRLNDAWEQDVVQPKTRLWDTYRLPAIRPHQWTVLREQLTNLEPGRAYPITPLLEAANLRLPHDPLDTDLLSGLLHGPMTWAGLAEMKDDRLFWQSWPETFPEEANASITLGENLIRVRLPSYPRLKPLIELLAWAEADASSLYLNADAIERAISRGADARLMADVLSALAGEPLPVEVFNRLTDWEHQARHFTLCTVHLLSSPDSDRLTALRSDHRMRPYFDQALSPYHLAVKPHHTADLQKSLQRRGISVSTPAGSISSPPEGELTPDMAAYLWLAVRVYRDLSRFANLPSTIPAALLDWLAAHCPPEQVDFLAQSAADLIDSLAATIDGFASLPRPAAIQNLTAIRQQVEAAYTDRCSLTIDYFTAGRGTITRRTIHPVMLTERSDVSYLEAYCELAGETRTFRLDRIVQIVEEPQET